MRKILIPVLLLGSLFLNGRIRNDEVFEPPETEISANPIETSEPPDAMNEACHQDAFIM